MLLPNKTAHTHACGSHLFAAAGLWHADEEMIVTALLNKACEGLNEALTTGDRYRARLLLRLLAALTTTNVVSMQSMFSMLNSMVTAAMQALEQGETVWPSHFCYIVCSQPYPACCEARKQYSAGNAAQTAPAVSSTAW